MRFIKSNIYGTTRGSFRFTCGARSYTSQMTTYAAAERRAKSLFKAGDAITVEFLGATN